MAVADSHLPFPCRLCHSPVRQADQIFCIERAPLSAQQLPTQAHFKAGGTAKQLCLYNCSSCGHYQLSSEPVAYWKEVITAACLSPEMRDFRFSQLRDWVEENGLQDKSVLEAGCGAGYLLDILMALGVEASGIEYSSEAVHQGLERGRNIRQGYILEAYKEMQSQYDGFICINFLEHAPEPVAYLRAVRSCCIPGAVGIVEVPNFDQDITESKSHNLIRDHLSYFTSHTLRLICMLAGFEVLSIRECWHGNDLEAKVRVPVKSVISNWRDGNPTIKVLSDLLLTENGRVAIWGASHQALTLLAILNPKNVVCIADSAPFKQGRVDPACGIPIVEPAEMMAKEPDLIIIIAAGYSAEVKKILANEYAFSGRAIILDEAVRQSLSAA